MPMIVLVGCYFAASLLTELVRRYAVSRGVIDRPNERSLHSAPTPRGGGLAIVLAVLSVHAWLMHTGLLAPEIGLPWAVGAGLLALLGWIDDLRSLPTTLRFGVQILIFSAVIAVGAGPVDDWHAAGIAAGVVAVVGLVWFVNLYNFMDGIDGLAGAQAVLTAMLLASLALGSGLRGPGIALLALCGASAGFLRHNWSPSKIFLGDVGSYFIGGYLGLYLWIQLRAGQSPWPWLIVLAPFLTDATLTLGRRILGGERWWAAHRTHAYQLLVAAGWSHGLVALAFMLLGAPLAGMAWLAFHRPLLGPWLALFAYALTVTIWRMIVVLTNRRAVR